MNRAGNRSAENRPDAAGGIVHGRRPWMPIAANRGKSAADKLTFRLQLLRYIWSIRGSHSDIEGT